MFKKVWCTYRALFIHDLELIEVEEWKWHGAHKELRGRYLVANSGDTEGHTSGGTMDKAYCHNTVEAAQKHAETMRKKAIEATEKRMAKLKSIVFPWETT